MKNKKRFTLILSGLIVVVIFGGIIIYILRMQDESFQSNELSYVDYFAQLQEEGYKNNISCVGRENTSLIYD